MEQDYETVDYGEDTTRPLPPPIRADDIIKASMKVGNRKSAVLEEGVAFRKPPPPPSPNKPRYSKEPKPPPVPRSAAPPPPTAKKPGVQVNGTGSQSSSSRVAKTLPTKKPVLPARKQSAQINNRQDSESPPPLPPPLNPSHIPTNPAPLPARSSKSLPRFTATATHKQGSTSSDGETLMLADLVRKYSHLLPLRVRVDEGYCGSEERYVISAGDIYNFHFVKNEKMVSVKDCGDCHFSIPFNSEIQFGLLYNPNHNFEEALSGIVFRSVSEIVAANPPPRIVRVLDVGAHSSPSKTTVETGELLIIRKTGKTMLRKPFVKVYNFVTKEEKTLHDDSDVSFTTEPQKLKLYVSEILDQFPDSFPLPAMMFPPGEDAQDLPQHLTSDEVTLTHSSIESSMIATTCWEDEDEKIRDFDDDDHIPISIPIEMEIELTILQDADDEGLYQDTTTLLKSFDFSKVKNMKDDSDLSAKNGGRRSISKGVRKGYEFRGVDITVSKVISEDLGTSTNLPFRTVLNQPLPPIPPPSEDDSNIWRPPPSVSPRPPVPGPASKTTGRAASLDDAEDQNLRSIHQMKPRSHTIADSSAFYPPPDLDEDDYERTDLPPPLPASSQAHASIPPRHGQGINPQWSIPEQNESTEEMATVKASVKFVQSLVEALQENTHREMTALRQEILELNSTIQVLTESNKQLETQVKTLSKKASSAPERPERLSSVELTKTMDPGKQKENIEELKAFGVPEVLCLLEIMKLSQYCETFSEESIDGEILAECDDSLLENELRITNKLHRSRLLKVISGKHSASNLKQGLDPYGGTVGSR